MLVYTGWQHIGWREHTEPTEALCDVEQYVVSSTTTFRSFAACCSSIWGQVLAEKQSVWTFRLRISEMPTSFVSSIATRRR